MHLNQPSHNRHKHRSSKYSHHLKSRTIMAILTSIRMQILRGLGLTMGAVPKNKKATGNRPHLTTPWPTLTIGIMEWSQPVTAKKDKEKALEGGADVAEEAAEAADEEDHVSSAMGIEVTVATEKGMAIIEETETVIERTATTAVTEKAITAAIVIEVDAVAESGAEETDPRGAKVATAEETAADHAGADHQIHRGGVAATPRNRMATRRPINQHEELHNPTNHKSGCTFSRAV